MGELIALLLVVSGISLAVRLRRHERSGTPADPRRAAHDALAARARQAARRPIADIREGLAVAIEGLVEAHCGEALRTPLGGRACAAYRAVAERPSSRPGAPPIDETRAADFLLSDGTGSVRVRASGAHLVLSVDTLHVPEAALRAWLATHDVAARAATLVVREGALCIGDRALILGVARRDRVAEDAAARAGYRRATPATTWVIEASPAAPLVVLGARSTPRAARRHAWLEPWAPVPAARGRALEAELRREMADDHVLARLWLTAVAVREGADDVLFEIDVEPPRYAVAHLSWSGRVEPAPWPWAELFASWDDWVEHGMGRDHAEWRDDGSA